MCQITGKKVITGNNVSKSHAKTRRKFYPNLFKKKFFLEEENKWVRLKVSAAGMRTINKVGLAKAMKDAQEKGFFEKSGNIKNQNQSKHKLEENRNVKRVLNIHLQFGDSGKISHKMKNQNSLKK